MKSIILCTAYWLYFFSGLKAQDVQLYIGNSENYQGYKFLNNYISNSGFPELEKKSSNLEMGIDKIFNEKAIGLRFNLGRSSSAFEATKFSMLKSNSFELIYTGAIDYSLKFNKSPVIGFGFGKSDIFLCEYATNISSISAITSANLINQYVFTRDFVNLIFAYRVSYELLEHNFILCEFGTRVFWNNENYRMSNNGYAIQQQVNNEGYKFGLSPFLAIRLAIY